MLVLQQGCWTAATSPLFVSKDTTKLGLMLQAIFFTSSIWEFYEWYMGFIPPALTNQISAFGTTMIKLILDHSCTKWEALRWIADAWSRYNYNSVIIGRWGLPQNLLSEQSRSRTEASRTQNRGRAKRRSVNDSSYSLCCLAMATLRDREAPPPRAFTWLGCYDLNLLDTA